MVKRLVFRSILVLTLLFGLLYAVGTAVLYKLNLPLGWAIGFSVGMVALQYLLGPYFIQWFFRITWVEPRDVSPGLDAFLQDHCRARGIPVPRFGIIEDGHPNAFTFGHLPSNARVVVTRGLLEMLSPTERDAVLAHELGHVAHYDFLVMAVASLVPLLLYNLYLWTRRGRNNQAIWAVSMGAYAAYLLSQMAVLMLSRIREFFADEHAVESIPDANALSSALVKIAYGMACLPRDIRTLVSKDKATPKEKVSRMLSVGALGIGDVKAGSALAMTGTDGAGAFSLERMGEAMRWDLWNPWAGWFELFSTHPRVARRVAEVSRLAQARGQAPLVAPLGPVPCNPWPAFFRDILVKFLPWLGLGAGLVTVGCWTLAAGTPAFDDVFFADGKGVGLTLLLFGLGWSSRLVLSYPGAFAPRTVRSFMAEWDVSQIKGLPGILQGTVIGRGVPGLFWSKDLVLQDGTGFITLLYRQPLGFLESLFGLLKAQSLAGREVTVQGWFRRGPSPSFEASRLTFEDGAKVGCYYRQFQWVLAILASATGALLLISSKFLNS